MNESLRNMGALIWKLLETSLYFLSDIQSNRLLVAFLDEILNHTFILYTKHPLSIRHRWEWSSFEAIRSSCWKDWTGFDRDEATFHDDLSRFSPVGYARVQELSTALRVQKISIFDCSQWTARTLIDNILSCHFLSWIITPETRNQIFLW